MPITTRVRRCSASVGSPAPLGIISRRLCGLVEVKARSYERFAATVVCSVISRFRQE